MTLIDEPSVFDILERFWKSSILVHSRLSQTKITSEGGRNGSRSQIWQPELDLDTGPFSSSPYSLIDLTLRKPFPFNLSFSRISFTPSSKKHNFTMALEIALPLFGLLLMAEGTIFVFLCLYVLWALLWKA